MSKKLFLAIAILFALAVGCSDPYENLDLSKNPPLTEQMREQIRSLAFECAYFGYQLGKTGAKEEEVPILLERAMQGEDVLGKLSGVTPRGGKQ